MDGKSHKPWAITRDVFGTNVGEQNIMSRKSASTNLFNFCVFAAFLLSNSTRLVAQNKEVVLHAFDASDGASPQGTLIADAQLNLYGVAYAGGNGKCTYQFLPSGCGTVFELTRQPLGN